MTSLLALLFKFRLGFYSEIADYHLLILCHGWVQADMRTLK